MELTSKQRKILEKNAQPLSAFVQIGGAGVNEEQLKQIARLISEHELIKVKYNIVKSLDDKDEIKQTKLEYDKLIAEKTGSVHVRTIGNVAIFYAPAKKPEDRKFEKALLKA